MSRIPPDSDADRCVALCVMRQKDGGGGRCRKPRVEGSEACGRHRVGFIRFDEPSVDPRIAERARAVLED